MLVCIVNRLREKTKAAGTFDGLYVDANRVQMNLDLMDYFNCYIYTKDNIKITVNEAIVERDGDSLVVTGYIQQVKRL